MVRAAPRRRPEPGHPRQFAASYAVPFLLGRPLTSRTELLNCLVSRDELDRYLEIGVEDRGNFRERDRPGPAQRRSRGATFSMTSDEFFASGRGCPEYDLVFIDGLHEEDQVLRDIENALDRSRRAVGSCSTTPTHPPPGTSGRCGVPAGRAVERHGLEGRGRPASGIRSSARHPRRRLGCAVLTRHPHPSPSRTSRRI